MFQGTDNTQELLRFMKKRLHGVAVTRQGIRPFLNDGHKGESYRVRNHQLQVR